MAGFVHRRCLVLGAIPAQSIEPARHRLADLRRSQAARNAGSPACQPAHLFAGAAIPHQPDDRKCDDRGCGPGRSCLHRALQEPDRRIPQGQPADFRRDLLPPPAPRRDRHPDCMEAGRSRELRRRSRGVGRALLTGGVSAASSERKDKTMRTRMIEALRNVTSSLVAGTLLALGIVAAPDAIAAESVTYLFPAPPSLPAFGPIQLAKGKGYFAQAGLDVNYAVGRGGVDVAKQVGAGNAPLGGIVSDGPIMVRQNGVPIKIVAVFGGKGFMQLVAREDSNIQTPGDLKGKTISVMSFQDTTYYALLGLLASAGLTQADVNIQSAGPSGVWELVATGKAAAMAGVPDWIPPIQTAGTKVKVIPSDQYFPHMAQAIGVSDQAIKDKPELVGKFVKAALRGMKDIMDDPNKAAEDFVGLVPEWKGKEGAIKATFNYYATLVYPGQPQLGEVNVERLTNLQDFYLAKGIIQRKSPVEELYTNQFIK